MCISHPDLLDCIFSQRPSRIFASPSPDTRYTLLSVTHTPIVRHSHGLHKAAQLAEAARVQILGSRPFIGVQVHPEAILHTCRHQMLSYVYGVSEALTYLADVEADNDFL